MGITRPKANKPMSKRRRTKYNDKNFHVQYFITAPKQQSNNAKECQHQNNVAGGLGRGLGLLGPQSPGLGPGSWRQEGVFFFVFFSGFGKSSPGGGFPVKTQEKNKKNKKNKKKTKKNKKKTKNKKNTFLAPAAGGPSQDPGDPGGLGPGPGPRPHDFDVGTLLHCLIAALELWRSSERGSSYYCTLSFFSCSLACWFLVWWFPNVFFLFFFWFLFFFCFCFFGMFFLFFVFFLIFLVISSHCLLLLVISLICLFNFFVPFVCFICLFHLFVSFVCFICLFSLFV